MFSPGGLTAYLTFVEEHAFKPGSNDWQRETQEIPRPVGEGISELRIDCGPGYRVYFKMHGRKAVILLAGGDKSTQGSDIKTASRLARNL